METDRQRQTERETETEIGTETDRQTETETDRHRKAERDREPEKDKEIERQRLERHADRETDRRSRVKARGTAVTGAIDSYTLTLLQGYCCYWGNRQLHTYPAPGRNEVHHRQHGADDKPHRYGQHQVQKTVQVSQKRHTTEPQLANLSLALGVGDKLKCTKKKSKGC